MFQDFNQILQEHNLLKKDNHILLAVSGGVDSIVLFHLMQNIPETKRPKLSVAHVNHQLRPEADREEQFVKQLASRYRVPFYSFIWEKAAHPDSGIEEAARNIRYSFFEQLMEQNKMNVLMTAHHQDDQVETILMKLTRGSTLAQLMGIAFSQSFSEGELVRPLLGFSKQMLYDLAKEQQWEFIEDSTNFELGYMRNRFRNEIIPLLRNENQQFDQHVIQFASDLEDLLEVSKTSIETAFNKVVRKKQDSWQIDRLKFSNLSAATQRMVLKTLLDHLYKNEKDLYKSNYMELLQEWILNGEVNTQLDLQNDFIAMKGYESICFSKQGPETSSIDNEHFILDAVGQWVQLSEYEKIGLFPFDSADRKEWNRDSLLMEEGKFQLPLTIRHRQAGDRMRYAGLKGSKKIKDIFIDEKVPVKQRNQAWLVEDSLGTILWLISYRKMNLFTTKETDKLIYVLKYKKDEY